MEIKLMIISNNSYTIFNISITTVEHIYKYI